MLTIYAKTQKTKDGKTFKIYLTTLKKSGEEIVVRVRFNHDVPKEFPVNIEVERNQANLQTRSVFTADRQITSHTLWIREWDYADEAYRDKSLDDVEL